MKHIYYYLLQYYTQIQHSGSQNCLFVSIIIYSPDVRRPRIHFVDELLMNKDVQCDGSAVHHI